MGILKLSGLMAFCLEYANGTHTVYFAESDTLDLKEPVIHRYYCSKSQFDSIVPGGEYALKTRGRRILDLSLSEEYEIDDDFYHYLLHWKMVKYGGGSQKRFDPEDYYSFSELLQLIRYREDLKTRFLNGFLKFWVFLAALALSPILYIVMLALILPGSSAVGAPVFAVLTLPLMVFLLALLHQLAQYLLLRYERTRYGMLRTYTLRHGGARLALNPSADVRAWMVGFGTVSAGMALMGLIMLFVL